MYIYIYIYMVGGVHYIPKQRPHRGRGGGERKRAYYRGYRGPRCRHTSGRRIAERRIAACCNATVTTNSPPNGPLRRPIPQKYNLQQH